VKKTTLIFALAIVSIFGIESRGAHAADTINAPLVAYRTPFNNPETHSPNITPFYRWTGVLARMDARAKPLRPWLDNRKMLEGMPPVEMVQDINDIINKYDYIADITNWGVSDYWETPAEFFAHGGDCEDFAIAKYAWLRFLGVPEERLRIAIVYDRIRELPHAVLILYINNKAMILDSQVSNIRDSDATSRYRIEYSINRLGWWLPTKAGDIRVGMAGDMSSVEPASGDDGMQFSRNCLDGLSLPGCINAIEPSAE
jgi:predicted transglutaminase-like cysteine proteinase